jgi:1,6-anhydro-N-acetylmuramate kinase
MKKIVIAVVSVGLIGIGILNAASTPTPVNAVATVTAVKNVNERMKEQMRQTQKDLKAGKLTTAQATAVKKQILAIRQEELNDMKSNGQKQLTDSQKAELNSELDGTQGSI